MQRSYLSRETGRVELVRLTQRERELLSLLTRPIPYKAVAEIMHIQETSVRNQAARLFVGIRVSGRQAAVSWAMQHPEVFSGDSVEVRCHPEGCGCGSPYCAMMARMQVA